jgi:glycosyltransferase involved in cell wall biosynthesis
MVYLKEIMPKVAVCIPTAKGRKQFYSELLKSLKKQTFQDFKIYSVKDVEPIGKAKYEVVKKALKDNPEYISMIDDDDLVEPTYLESLVKRLDRGLDWAFTWGKLFGDREGYIHGDMQIEGENHRPSQFMGKADMFKAVSYDSQMKWAEDLDLWRRLDITGYEGDIVKEELYLRRWHKNNLTTTRKPARPDYFRFHIPGYVHLPCSEEYMACAFTQKILKLSKMLLSLGHEVYVYGSEGSDVPCTEFIQTHTLKDIAKEWGDGDNRFEIGYDYKNNEFRHDFNKERTETTKDFMRVCVEEITKRKQPDDFLLVMQGQYHRTIYESLGLYLTCEPGIGYRGSDTKNFRAFESHYLQSFAYGSEHPFKSINGSYYDRVIPNYFDPKDFEYSDKKGDYYLYIGRMIKRKGVWTAIKATEAIGAKLILVGQADPEIDVNNLPKHCDYQGFADVDKRKKLMAGAIATYTPTEYLEAFAGTHIESMLSGTPPITTDFGVFPGTIPDYLNGEIGFRCNTLQDFVDASIRAKGVDHTKVREYGERFLMDSVKLEFEKWFLDLYQVYLSTLNKDIKGWHFINGV